MRLFRRLRPAGYTREQISNQIADIASLQRMREKADNHDETIRFSVEIEMAQRYLEFMLQETLDIRGGK